MELLFGHTDGMPDGQTNVEVEIVIYMKLKALKIVVEGMNEQ